MLLLFLFVHCTVSSRKITSSGLDVSFSYIILVSKQISLVPADAFSLLFCKICCTASIYIPLIVHCLR